MLNIAICDDNKVCLQELRVQIEMIFKNRPGEYAIQSYTSGGQLLCADGYDIVLLDIEMDGINGLETARRLRARGDSCKLVFVTAHERYALSAYDMEPTHYLLKPIDTKKLKGVLDKIVCDLQVGAQKLITVKHGSGLLRIAASDILFIEVFDRKLFLHTSQYIYDFYEKLDSLEKDLPDYFFRCHRSYIVNLLHVRRYDKTSITLDHGETVLLSKRKYGAFCRSFLSFLKRGGVSG